MSTARRGVEGINTASSGGVGVYGTAPQFGLYGVATGSGNTVGVYAKGADGLQGAGTVNGVYASGTNTGVYGVSPGYAVYAAGTGSAGIGVYGTGVDGVQGSGNSFGVIGSTSAGIAGTYGYFQGPSATGSSGPWDISYDCTGGPTVFCYALPVLHQAGVWADSGWNGDSSTVDIRIFPHEHDAQRPDYGNVLSERASRAEKSDTASASSMPGTFHPSNFLLKLAASSEAPVLR